MIIIRNGSVQKEVFAGKKDTSVWRITWTNASSYKLKFIRKDTAISQEEKSFYNVHIPLVRVLSVGNDYYIFTGDLDSIKGPGSITDTIWFKRQIKR